MADVAQLLSERGKTHGDYTDHARITQDLKDVLRASPSYSRMYPTERESIDMICHKLGRIAAGDPHFHDHWLDISGYAKLVADLSEAA